MSHIDHKEYVSKGNYKRYTGDWYWNKKRSMPRNQNQQRQHNWSHCSHHLFLPSVPFSPHSLTTLITSRTPIISIAQPQPQWFVSRSVPSLFSESIHLSHIVRKTATLVGSPLPASFSYSLIFFHFSLVAILHVTLLSWCCFLLCPCRFLSLPPLAIKSLPFCKPR